MHRRIAQMVSGVLAVLVLLTAMSCTGLITVPVGEEREETRTVELGGASSAQVQVTMGVGDLRLSGGATSGLMDARFLYNVGEWRPLVEYTVRDGRGHLRVEQPSGPDFVPLGNIRYEWDLRFRDDVPLDVRVKVGAGTAKLILGGLRLERLDLEMGAGDVILDLTGDWSRNLEGRIKGGVGNLTVQLPRETGVRIEVTSGVGHVNATDLQYDGQAYINAAYGRSPVVLHLSIEAGVGNIELRSR